MMASFTPSSSSTTSVASGICNGLSHETSVNLNFLLHPLGTFWQCNPGYIQEKTCKLDSHNSSLDNNLRSRHLSGADNYTYSTSSLQIANGAALTNGLNGIADKQFNYGVPNPRSQFGSNISSSNFLAPLSLSSVGAINVNQLNSSEMWPNDSDRLWTGMSKHSPLLLRNHDESVLDIYSTELSNSNFVPKGKIKRQLLYYHSVYRQFGLNMNKYSRPYSIAVNALDDIIFVDSNQHKVVVFGLYDQYQFEISGCNTKSGHFYPYHVAVEKTTGNIIVLERSPAHQVQVFNRYGMFKQKFGANVLDNPRTLCVDDMGRIIVVESKVKRLHIFDHNGIVLRQFDCSNYCIFPISLTVNDKYEIFICDNRAHCVKVFNYNGVFLRQIGKQGITNYPIAVEINSAGEIVVADNHYGFNLTIFTQEGQLVSALKGKNRYRTLNDMAITGGGLVFLANSEYGLCCYISKSNGPFYV